MPELGLKCADIVNVGNSSADTVATPIFYRLGAIRCAGRSQRPRPLFLPLVCEHAQQMRKSAMATGRRVWK